MLAGWNVSCGTQRRASGICKKMIALNRAVLSVMATSANTSSQGEENANRNFCQNHGVYPFVSLSRV